MNTSRIIMFFKFLFILFISFTKYPLIRIQWSLYNLWVHTFSLSNISIKGSAYWIINIYTLAILAVNITSSNKLPILVKNSSTPGLFNTWTFLTISSISIFYQINLTLRIISVPYLKGSKEEWINVSSKSKTKVFLPYINL